MAKNNNLQDFLTDIANTIREENGTTALINPQDFGSKIKGIGDKLRKLVSGTLKEIKETDLQGIENIKPYAFYHDNFITSVSIPDSVTSIGNGAFSSCWGLTSIRIGNSVKSIGGGAFQGCVSLTSVIIPDRVTSIEGWAFAYCSRLISVTFPSSVTSVGNNAFNDCSSLTFVKFMGQPPTIKSNTFQYCNSVAKYDFRGATSIPPLSSTISLGHASGCQIVVPDSLYDSWQRATNWTALTNVVWVKASEYAEE